MSRCLKRKASQRAIWFGDKGAYKGSNYEKMQQQRYLERGVRKHKEKSNEMQKMYNETKDERYLAEVKKMKSQNA